MTSEEYKILTKYDYNLKQKFLDKRYNIRDIRVHK